jgi:hypothetical protein
VFVRWDWKSLPGTNALAYNKNLLITDEISFITLGPGVEVMKLFFIISNEAIKLARFSLTSHSSLA